MNIYIVFCWLRQLLARTFASQTFSLRIIARKRAVINIIRRSEKVREANVRASIEQARRAPLKQLIYQYGLYIRRWIILQDRIY